jgi:hypothetical protein
LNGPTVAELGRAFHECRALAAIDSDQVDLELVEEYAGTLSDRFGILIRSDSIADAIDWLTLASLLAHRVEDLDRDLTAATLSLHDARTIEARTSADPWNVAMRVLNACKDLSPVAVRIDAGNRWLAAVLLPDKRLLAQEQAGQITRGWKYQIAVAPAAHLRTRPANRRRTWTGAIPTTFGNSSQPTRSTPQTWPDLCEHVDGDVHRTVDVRIRLPQRSQPLPYVTCGLDRPSDAVTPQAWHNYGSG